MLSFPLAKLSTAQDALPDETKFSWTHDTQNLVVVIDTFGSHGSASQLLKVVQGTQVRQLIEIERLANEGNDLIRTMQEHRVELKNEQLPISALVRCPLLAVRWQLPDQKVRRAQLKFKNNEDFSTVYNHLLHLGLRMSSANEPNTRPQTPSPVHSSPIPVSQSAVTVPNAQVTRLSCPPSRLAEISNRPYTATNAPTALESHLQETAAARPLSALTTSYPQSHGSVPPHLQPPEYFARPSSATSAILDRASTSLIFSSNKGPAETIERSSSSSEDRPGTALLYNRPDTGEAALPPRRELPFPRSAGSDGSRPSSRPSTSLMGPPPLPARVASLRPVSSPATNQDTDLPPLPKPTFLGNTSQKPSWMQQAPRTPTQDQIAPSSPRATSRGEQGDQIPFSLSSRTPSPNRPSSSLSSTPQVFGSSDAQSPQPTLPTSDPPHATPNAPGFRDAGLSGPHNLAGYAAQSDDDRRAALNEFIIRHLEDDNFLVLVEDMETCWTRNVLGMK